jgi:hypothetical protein
MKNSKSSGKSVSRQAAKILSSDSSSKIQKSLAASVISQSNTSKQTGKSMESTASKVLRSPKYSDTTKTLAGSVLSQSNNER